MIDQKTPNLLLPLPHPGNALQDDVLRLRDALSTIDATLAALATKADKTEVDQKLTELIGSAPVALNQLHELAAALGNDPNFAVTIGLQVSQASEKAKVVSSTLRKMRVRSALGLSLFP